MPIPTNYKRARPWHLGGALAFLVGALLFVKGSKDPHPLYFVSASVLYVAAMAMMWKAYRRMSRSDGRAVPKDEAPKGESDRR